MVRETGKEEEREGVIERVGRLFCCVVDASQSILQSTSSFLSPPS